MTSDASDGGPGAGHVRDAVTDQPRRHLVTDIGRGVVRVAWQVLVRPVRTGRLRTTGWPAGLGAIMGLVVTAYLVGVAVVVLSGPIRERSSIAAALGTSLTLPRWTLFLFTSLIVLCLALLHTATMHLPAWARVGGLAIVVLTLAEAATVDTDPRGVGRLTGWGACLLVIGLTAVRWRAGFAWWEFVASLAVLGGSFTVMLRAAAASAQPLGFDLAPLVTTTAIRTIAALGAPAAVVAGLAFAQLTVSFTHRVGEAIGPRGRGLVWLVIVLAGARVLMTAGHVGRPTDTGVSRLSEVGSAVLLVVLVAVVSLVVLGRRLRSLPALSTLDEVVGDVALPAAVALTVTVVPSLLLSGFGRILSTLQDERPSPLTAVGSALGSTTTIVAARVVAALAMGAYAVWLRHRGRVAAALVVGVCGLALLTLQVRRLLADAFRIAWTDESVNDVVSTLAVVALVVFAARRALTPRRTLALGIMIGLSMTYSVRSALEVPLTALLGVSGTATVLLGLLWSTLTQGEHATRGTARFPMPSRVLLHVGSALSAVTALGFLAVARMPSVGIDLSGFAVLGDQILGTGLLLAAYAVLAWTCFLPACPSTASGDAAVPATVFPDTPNPPPVMLGPPPPPPGFAP